MRRPTHQAASPLPALQPKPACKGPHCNTHIITVPSHLLKTVGEKGFDFFKFIADKAVLRGLEFHEQREIKADMKGAIPRTELHFKYPTKHLGELSYGEHSFARKIFLAIKREARRREDHKRHKDLLQLPAPRVAFADYLIHVPLKDGNERKFDGFLTGSRHKGHWEKEHDLLEVARQKFLPPQHPARHPDPPKPDPVQKD